MADTIEGIREWHRDRGVTDDTAVFYYQWIDTLLAEIDRLEAQSKRAEQDAADWKTNYREMTRGAQAECAESLEVLRRLSDAEAVCRAYGELQRRRIEGGSAKQAAIILDKKYDLYLTGKEKQ